MNPYEPMFLGFDLCDTPEKNLWIGILQQYITDLEKVTKISIASLKRVYRGMSEEGLLRTQAKIYRQHLSSLFRELHTEGIELACENADIDYDCFIERIENIFETKGHFDILGKRLEGKDLEIFNHYGDLFSYVSNKAGDALHNVVYNSKKVQKNEELTLSHTKHGRCNELLQSYGSVG